MVHKVNESYTVCNRITNKGSCKYQGISHQHNKLKLKPDLTHNHLAIAFYWFGMKPWIWFSLSCGHSQPWLNCGQLLLLWQAHEGILAHDSF